MKPTISAEKRVLTIFLSLLVIVSPATLPAESKKPWMPVVSPDKDLPAPYRISGKSILIKQGGLALRVRHLDENERGVFFRMRSRIGFDPFPPRAVYPRGFTFFELSIANDTGEDVHLSPSMCSLSTNKNKRVLFPKDMGELYSFFNDIFDRNERLVKAALGGFYSRSTIIGPGKIATRLLLFEGMHRRTKSAVLQVDCLKIGTEDYDFEFPFEVTKKTVK